MMENENLGYNAYFDQKRNELGPGEFSVARVISEHKEAYKVKNANGEYLARITGKQLFDASSREDYPAVGDWVAITELDKDHARTSPEATTGQAVIRGIVPRATLLKRKHGDKSRANGKDETQVIAANIDVAFVVESVDRDYNLNRFERYFALAEDGGVRSAIIVNKVDLLSEEELDKKIIELRNRFPHLDILKTSTVNTKGLDELKKYIHKGKTYCFLGSSGVGKSSLINTLLNNPPAGGAIKTGDISSCSGRGKHVTTNRQMYFLENGGIVIDNPGMREGGMTDVSKGIDTFFDEITALAQKCPYADCTHIHEPGCEVINAVKSGVLDEEKYSKQS